MSTLDPPRRQQNHAAHAHRPRRARRFFVLLAALCLFAASASHFLSVRGRAAATTFYSQGSLPPELFASWNTQRGGGGAQPTGFTDGDTFVIQNTHSMSTLSPLGWTVSGTGATVEIEGGGILTANAVVSVPNFTVDDGGTYIHNAASASADGNASDIPGSTSRTFKPASTVTVKQWATSGSTAPAALPHVSWGNLTIDVATLGGNWQQSGAVSTVQGNLDIKTTGGSSNEFILTSSGALSLNLNGNLVVEGGALDLSNGAGVTTLNLAGNYSQTGGTLTDTGPGVASFNFNGGSASVIFDQTGGTLTDTNINWSIASGKTVQLGNGLTSLAFTNAASRTFDINSGGRLLDAVQINNGGALNVNGEFRLTDGGFATGNAFVYDPSATLAFVASGSYGVGDDAYWPATNGPANVNVLGAGVTLNGISRTVGNLFQTSAGVTLSGATLTLNGTCQINGNGFFNNPPTYGPSSLLKYNIGGPPAYGRNNEWSPGATSQPGYPANVRLTNQTTLNLPNGSNSSPFQMSGTLTIDSDSTLDMGAATHPLTVLGDLSLGGTLKLSTATGGDFKLGGNWTRAASATFTPNSRAVFFNGAGAQTVAVTGGGTQSFAYLVVDKASGNLSPSTPTDLSVTQNTGNVLQLLGAGGIDLNGQTLTLSGDGGNVLVSGGARTVTGTGTFGFTGAKTVTGGGNDSLVFDTGVTVTLSKGVNFGAALSHVKGTLSIKQNGFVDTNPPVYDTGSTLEYDNGTSYDAAAEFPSSGVQNVSLASTTQLNLNGDKSVAGTFAAGARNVGTTAASPFSLSADTITVSTGTLNLNSVATASAFTASGAAGINVAGNWNVTGFSAGASTVTFDGTGAQVIQTASAFNNLTASNDLSLGASFSVGSTLSLGTHKITTGANTLSIGDAGTVSRTSGYIIGTERKSFNSGGGFTFDVGTSNGYSPVDANSTTGTGSLSVKPTQSKQPNISATNALSRYWTLNGTGLTTDLTFHYLDGDVSGTEANYKVLKHDTSLSIPTPQSVNAAANTATVNGVSSFSDWTLADPGSLFGQIQFAQANTNTPEGDSGTHTVDITVRRTGGSSGAVSVDYSVADGTANAGSDYSVASATGTLNWGDADAADKTITITVNGDTTYEANETVNITLSNPSGGAAINGTNPATLTITNDDAPPTLSVNDVTHNEGNAGTTSFTFTVTKSGNPTEVNASVQIATQNGSAVAPGDYQSNSDTLTFLPADTTKTFTVLVNGDTTEEPDEDFTVHLSSPAGATISDADGTGTIKNDDNAPVFSVNDVTHAEGNTGTTSFTFTVTKTGATAFSTSVDFATQDGTATVADGDYQSNSGTLQFAAADTQKTFTVHVNGDTKAELDETFKVVLTNPLGATVGDDTGTGTIQNDDESVSDGQLIISEFRLRGPGAAPTPVSATTTAAAPTQANGAKNSGGASGATASGSASGISATKRRASVSFAPNPPADTSPQANDEFVELYNNTDSPLLVTTTDGSKGWALAASDGVVRFVVPDGTVIPARGHFLGVNKLGYSLSAYPAGNDGSTTTTAAGDPILLADGTPDTGYTLDIPDNAGIAVFRTATPANFSTATRLDAAGSTSETNTLYKEGAGYPALSPSDIAQNLEHSFFRNICSLQPGQGCTSQGLPKDTGDNGADFLFADTKGTPTAAGQRLGAPGPENLSSHIVRDDAQMPFSLLDRSKDSTLRPNRDRNPTPNSPNASVASFGTLSLRRRVTNSTGAPVVQLRFRIIEVTTFPAPAATADLRALSSTQVSVSNVGDADTCGGAAPCTATVEGTTVEQPPEQLNPGGNNQGGGYNASMAVGSIDLAHPLAPGASVNVQFLLGVRQTGNFRIFVNVEAVTAKE